MSNKLDSGKRVTGMGKLEGGCLRSEKDFFEEVSWLQLEPVMGRSECTIVPMEEIMSVEDVR